MFPLTMSPSMAAPVVARPAGSLSTATKIRKEPIIANKVINSIDKIITLLQEFSQGEWDAQSVPPAKNPMVLRLVTDRSAVSSWVGSTY